MFLKKIKSSKKMVLASVFFFYLGAWFTMNFAKIDCTTGHYVSRNLKTDNARIRYEDSDKVEYTILVLSGPNNVERRDAIRNTWKNLLSNIIVENGERLHKWNITRKTKLTKPNTDFIKFYFVIGISGLSVAKQDSILDEQREHDDILVLLNLEDGYMKLAEKMIETLKILIVKFRKLQYIVKCDDDSFVRVDSIIDELEKYGPNMMYSPLVVKDKLDYKKLGVKYDGLYWGYFHGNAHVQQRGKWKEDGWFLCDKYLPYALGGGYIISASVANFVAGNADILSRYKSEDVSLGVWTAALGGINRIHDERFDTQWISRGCRNNYIVRHKQSIQDMYDMYSLLVASNGTVLCKKEIDERSSYQYNWAVLPSMCCRH